MCHHLDKLRVKLVELWTPGDDFRSDFNYAAALYGPCVHLNSSPYKCRLIKTNTVLESSKHYQRNNECRFFFTFKSCWFHFRTVSQPLPKFAKILCWERQDFFKPNENREALFSQVCCEEITIYSKRKKLGGVEVDSVGNFFLQKLFHTLKLMFRPLVEVLQSFRVIRTLKCLFFNLKEEVIVM